MYLKISYSGNRINLAGDLLAFGKIKNGNQSALDFSQAMDVLSYWRFSHDKPLQLAFDELNNICKRIDNDSLCAKRLKRHHSIVAKLKRFDNMKLRNMQDIGGCRAVVKNEKVLRKVVKAIKRRKIFRGEELSIRSKDYVLSPKPDGYRGYHLVSKILLIDDRYRSIEIQVRTRIQHYWATAVEIIDLFTGQSLK